MSLDSVKRLDVWRTFSDGGRHRVGVLAQNRQGVCFQYAGEYLARFANLSPFGLTFDASLQTAPRSPHAGLHGVFTWLSWPIAHWAPCFTNRWNAHIARRKFWLKIFILNAFRTQDSTSAGPSSRSARCLKARMTGARVSPCTRIENTTTT